MFRVGDVVARLFGTDGVRGVANVDLTPELALRLASAAVAELTPADPAGPRPLAVVGRDPRPSGELLQAAVVAGLLSAGADVVLLGVVPTPAVAHALAAGFVGLPAPAVGVMISASHNPMPDNGLQLFAAGGTKLPDELEDRIQDRMHALPGSAPAGAEVGRVVRDLSGDIDWYVDHVVSTIDMRLDGLRVVVDCANGAAAKAAPAAYRQAGAEVVVIHDDVSGYHINDGCGATHLESLRAAVVAERADVGLAHDGDADRCLAVDADGNVVDGDAIVAVLGVALHEQQRLRADALAVTVMSNLGLRHALAARGIRIAETAVGDRYVLERMVAEGLSFGGEQSGHVILLDHATTGDGILTGLHLMARVAGTGKPLAELASVMQRLPQVLVNVRVTDKQRAMEQATALAAQAEQTLGANGRVLVRPSGTEALLRIMVEAPSEEQARATAERIASAVTA
jgi:phosphoglucosamine mutase